MEEKYYIRFDKDGFIEEFALKEDVDSGKVVMTYDALIDYYPILYWNKFYTKEKFAEVEKTPEYIEEQSKEKKEDFDRFSKEMEDDYLYIEYQGHKISLDEILFKSLFYSSVTDLFVYLRAEDKTIFKMTRTSFLLLITKAKLNLKATEEALYNAQQNYDPTKTLEESIQALKSVLDAIDKIFND